MALPFRACRSRSGSTTVQHRSEKATTTTASDGSYLFGSPATLGSGQRYEVDFGPNTTYDSYLYAWYGSIITAYTSGTRLHGGSFDIANVNLLSPAYGATVSLPATFTWQRRGLAGDTYRIFLFDLDTGDGALTRDLGDTGSTTLTSLPDWVINGRQYGWSVVVCSGEDGCGDAFYYHVITFFN